MQQRSAKGEDMDGKNKDPGEARVIGSAELRQLVPFSDSYFWRLEKAGQFPRRIKIGQHRVGWALNEIVAWIEARKAQRGRS
jgi:prophage regulatory protein